MGLPILSITHKNNGSLNLLFFNNVNILIGARLGWSLSVNEYFENYLYPTRQWVQLFLLIYSFQWQWPCSSNVLAEIISLSSWSISSSVPFLNFLKAFLASSWSFIPIIRYLGDSGTNIRIVAWINPINPFNANKTGHKSWLPKHCPCPRDTAANTPVAKARGPAVPTAPRILVGVISLH